MKLDKLIKELTKFRDDMKRQEKQKNLEHVELEITCNFLIEGPDDDSTFLYELDIKDIFHGTGPFPTSDAGLHPVLWLEEIPKGPCRMKN